MSQQILQVDQAMLETTLDRMVRKSVEETLNAIPDASGRRDPVPPDTSAVGRGRRTGPAITGGT